MCSVLQKHVFAYPPVFPVGIDDLLLGPPAGVFPTRGGFGIGGGMLVGPDDPRWQGGLFPFSRTPILLICSFGTGPDDPRWHGGVGRA
ncbi:hypothetical protein AAC387_Pa08g1803 [Persea americana]